MGSEKKKTEDTVKQRDLASSKKDGSGKPLTTDQGVKINLTSTP